MGKNLNGKSIGRGFTQRKNGLYYGRAMINGIEVSVNSVSLKKCKDKLKLKKNELIADIAKGLDIKKSNRTTLNEWFEEWLIVYKNDSDINEIKEKYQMTFGEIIGNSKLSKIINSDIQKAINIMNFNGLSTSSISDGYKILKECLEAAKNNNILLINPAIGNRLPKGV